MEIVALSPHGMGSIIKGVLESKATSFINFLMWYLKELAECRLIISGCLVAESATFLCFKFRNQINKFGWKQEFLSINIKFMLQIHLKITNQN